MSLIGLLDQQSLLPDKGNRPCGQHLHLTDQHFGCGTECDEVLRLQRAALEVRWKAASASGANDGLVEWWLNGVQQSGLSELDNDTLDVDTVRLGPQGSIPSGTQGTLYFDSFISRRSFYQGLGNEISSGPSSFSYDGNGSRVKATVNGVTTVYIGNWYEKTGTVVKKYYDAGSNRVAMSDNGTVKYLFGDHLGSTNVMADANGVKQSENLYKPWGEDRYSSGTLATTFGFTGQRAEGSVAGGLYYYGARWYDGTLGRWIQPDSIIPDQYNSQSWDRFAYVRDNPVNLIDPSGHRDEGPGEVIDDDWMDDINDPGQNYSDWYSGEYSGCTMCHYAHAQNKPILTNYELAAADRNFREWALIGYPLPILASLAVGGAEALTPALPFVIETSSPLIGKAGVDQVLKIINDPGAQTEIMVYVNEAGKRGNYFARFDILTRTAIHEVKNVANLSLTQTFMDQAYRYKSIADSAGLELHYWLINDAPTKVSRWLERLGVTVHTP